MNQSKDTIDIVYLWVDGADPLWRRKRQHALNHSNDLGRKKLARYGDVAGRYRDNQELRFNLRALEKFFPDHGHIYPGRVDLIFGQCVLGKTQDGKAHLAAAAGRPSKRCNAVHRAFCQEPFGNGRNGHMALLQVAYSARTAARLDA